MMVAAKNIHWFAALAPVMKGRMTKAIHDTSVTIATMRPTLPMMRDMRSAPIPVATSKTVKIA